MQKVAKKQQVKTKLKPELVVGLVAKIGTDIETVNDALEDELRLYGYKSECVRITETLSANDIKRLTKEQIDRSSFETYCGSAMDVCNELRSEMGNSVMAELAVREIVEKRKESGGDETKQSRAFIVRQLKRHEEVVFLRELYGDRFVLVSTYCPIDLRKKFLAEKIAKSKSSISWKEYFSEAEALIKRDEDEVGNSSGQNVRDVFPLADVIINGASRGSINETIRKFLRAYFGDPSVSPTNDEHGAYIAYAASLRSLDLSRQVGAAIFGSDHMVLSIGANEVPKYGGGTYKTDDIIELGQDGRDVALGKDTNSEMKALMAKDAALRTLGYLESNKLISKRSSNKFKKQLQDNHLLNLDGLKDMLVLDIGEFGRAVHAEMNAITDASRSHASTAGATLFCTTFPCHNCAKHIVASGIIRVVYLQPYPKSKADEMYPDSIAINPADEVDKKVRFEVLTGVAPVIFERIFGNKSSRKDKDGKAIPWSKQEAWPLVSHLKQSYMADEDNILHILTKGIRTISSKK